MKDTRNWFPHDDSARHDPKLAYLIRTHGFEGYGRFWALIEVFRSMEGYKIEKKPYNLASIASQLDMKDDEFNEFINFLSECDLIHNNTEFIYCPTLKKKMQYWDDKKEHMREISNKRWETKRKMHEEILDEAPITTEKEADINVDTIPHGDNAYLEFEAGVVKAWNSVASRKKNMYPIKQVTPILRTRLEERYKEPKFVRNYLRILRHIEENPYFHGKNKTGFVMSLQRLVDGERSYSNIVEQIGDSHEKESFGGEGGLVDQTIKTTTANIGTQVSPRKKIPV